MGTVITNIQSIDPLTGAALPVQTFQANSEVVIANSITGEQNPFNLTITSPVGAGLPPVGGVSFSSAASFSTSTGPFLAQYWEIESVQRQGLIEFEGILREDFKEQALGFNTIDLPLSSTPGLSIPFPVTFAEGTQISGVFSSTEFQATIEGTTNQLDSFVIEITDSLIA